MQWCSDHNPTYAMDHLDWSGKQWWAERQACYFTCLTARFLETCISQNCCFVDDSTYSSSMHAACEAWKQLEPLYLLSRCCYGNAGEGSDIRYLQHIVSWEPEGSYWYSKMFNWEPKGRYHHMWPCITKPTKSRIAQFCVMAQNRWSGSAGVSFRFWYILKEQSLFYILLKFGSIKRIISRFFCCFSRPIFLRSDHSCDHSTCPFISWSTWLSCLLWTLITFERSKLKLWKWRVVMNIMYSNSVPTFRIIW